MIAEEIFEAIQGSKLVATRYIYGVQALETGIQFASNKLNNGSNIVTITYDTDNTYSISFVKLIKPKYNHKTNTVTKHRKVDSYEADTREA